MGAGSRPRDIGRTAKCPEHGATSSPSHLLSHHSFFFFKFFFHCRPCQSSLACKRLVLLRSEVMCKVVYALVSFLLAGTRCVPLSARAVVRGQ